MGIDGTSKTNYAGEVLAVVIAAFFSDKQQTIVNSAPTESYSFSLTPAFTSKAVRPTIRRAHAREPAITTKGSEDCL
jgi:hypothetical protein